MAETAGLPSLPKTLQSYAGTVVVTAKGEHSRLPLLHVRHRVAGFSQLDKIVKGTDRFSNATGRLIFLTASVAKAADLIRTLAASCA